MSVSTKRRFSNDSTDVKAKKQKTIAFKEKEIKNSVSLVDEATGLSKCFHRVRAKMYLSLAPCYLEQPIEGLCQQHLDPLIMTYNPNVEGVIITYNNVRLSKENLNTDDDSKVDFKYVAKVSDENPFSFVWALVDFVVWRPRIGDILEGYTIMQSQSHIGLLINDVFSASIKKFYIPEDWYFVPSQADESTTEEGGASTSNFKSLGHWCDSNEVPIGGKMQFTVRAIHVNGKGLAIEGTLLTPGTERDSKPVSLENMKDNIKKHVKFDGGDEATTGVNDDEMNESLPVIEPLKEDIVTSIKDDDNEDSDEISSKDDAPKYNDDSSDSDSNSKSSDSDSDSESKDDSDSD